jgi:hypothetical protein
LERGLREGFGEPGLDHTQAPQSKYILDERVVHIDPTFNAKAESPEEERGT